MSVSLVTLAAAARMDFWEARSRRTVSTGVDGYLSRISEATSSSLDCVREARMRSLGDCEAKARAVVWPMPFGPTPVMRTGVVCAVLDFLGRIQGKVLIA